MAYIKNIFHYYENYNVFKEHLDNNLIDPNSICFIGDTRQIATQNKLFCLDKKEFDGIVDTVNDHTAILNNILGLGGPSIETIKIDNLSDVYSFLDGYQSNENLVEVLEQIKSSILDQVAETEESLLEDIYNTIDNFNAALSRLSDLSNKNAEDIANIKEEQAVIKTDIRGLTENVQHCNEIVNNLRNYVNSTVNMVRTDIKELDREVSSLNKLVTENSNNITALSDSLQSVISKIESLEEAPAFSDDFFVEDNTLFINKITNSELQSILI